jgi:hypothetical protein
LHSPQFDTRSALQNDEVFTGENEELFTGKNLGTETPHDKNIVQEMPFETPNNRENDLVKVKSKLKSSQQKCSKHKKTIKRLQLQLKIARDQARDNGIDDGGRSEESEDEAYYNGLKSEPDGGIDLDGNVVSWITIWLRLTKWIKWKTKEMTQTGSHWNVGQKRQMRMTVMMMQSLTVGIKSGNKIYF